MGAPELWRILVSLVGSGLALGAVLVVVKLLRFDLTRLPRQWIPPAVTCFMMMTSVALLLTLIQRGPQHAKAVEVDDRLATLTASTWSYRVYPLENWGELARRMSLGQELSRNLLEELKALGADVRRGADNDMPVGLYDNGRRPSDERIRHFAASAPFMSITGVVSRNKDGRYEATVELHRIDRRVRSELLLKKVVTFRGTNASSKEAAATIVAEIAEMARAEVDATRSGQ